MSSNTIGGILCIYLEHGADVLLQLKMMTNELVIELSSNFSYHFISHFGNLINRVFKCGLLMDIPTIATCFQHSITCF